MLELTKLLDLQLFAGEGAGDGGAGDGGTGATGQEAAAPVNPRARVNPMAGAKFGRQEEPESQVAADAAQPTEPEAPKRMSFRELLDSDPEYKSAYDKEVQAILRGRLKDHKGTVDRLNKANTLMQIMGDRYGLDVSDPANIDIDKLTEAVNADKALYEEAALREGVPVDVYMQSQQLQRKQAALDAREQQARTEAAARQEINSLMQRAAEFKAVNPGFDLNTEMENPTFARMVLNPPRGVGLPLQDAYYAVHRAEIDAARRQQQMAMTQRTAEQAVQKVSNAVASGSRRPAENGIANNAAAMTYTDPRQLTKEARAELKRQVMMEGKRIVWD